MKILNFFGLNTFGSLDLSKSKIMYVLLFLFCRETKFLCNLVFSSILDKNTYLLDFDEFPNIFWDVSTRASWRCFEHYRQLILLNNQRMRKYDFGEKKNLKVYKNKNPPFYYFENIKTDLLIYYGDGDELSSVKDNEDLKNFVKQSYSRLFKGYGHVTWIWGKNIKLFLNKLVDDIESDTYKDEIFYP